MSEVRDSNGWARWDYFDLIRTALAGHFVPEHYLAAVCSFGSFEGLPLAPAACRALGLPTEPAGVPAILRRDAAYLAAWRERAGVETWTAGSMLVAAITPAKLPWCQDQNHVLIDAARWSEGFERFRSLASKGRSVIRVYDLGVWAGRETLPFLVGRRGLRAARLSKIRYDGKPGGNLIRAAVASFQTAKGLAPTGAFDAETDRALLAG